MTTNLIALLQPITRAAGNPRGESMTFELEVVTPMFLAGAEVKKSQLEHEGLRVPSLRGVLRWWWRSAQTTSNPLALSADEGAIWGSTTCQGLVISSLKTTAAVIDRNIADGPGSPTFYLGFGAVGKTSRSGTEPGKPAIISGRFSFRATGSHIQLDALRTALRLLSDFGGLGSRSRRTWGSVMWTSENEFPLPVHLDAGGLKQSLHRTIDSFSSRKVNGVAISRSILSTDARLAVAERTFTDLGEVRQKLFNILKGENGQPGTHKGQWCFGLPHRAYQGPKLNRRGSSILFKIHRLESGFGLSALLMGGKFSPQGIQPSLDPLIATLNAVERL
jgi:hypothetical protein